MRVSKAVSPLRSATAVHILGRVGVVGDEVDPCWPWIRNATAIDLFATVNGIKLKLGLQQIRMSARKRGIRNVLEFKL